MYHASKVLTGVCELHRQTRVDLHLRLPEYPAPASTALSIDVDGRRAVIDLSDSSRTFSDVYMRNCDIYFKRGYYAPDIPAKFASKVYPYGLNYACASRRSLARVLAFGLRHWRIRRKQLVDLLRNVYRFASLSDPRKFEYPATLPAVPLVHFQARLWHPHEVYPDDPEEVNQRRCRLVRVLRKELGNRFAGGLVPTDLALQRYPELITSLPVAQRKYLAATKAMLVGIYTRGLHHSTAFKMPEYMASSKCVVSEPIRNAAPVPLVEGRNYLRFSTVDQCVEQCVRLLEDRTRSEEMRWQNWKYYEENVRADAHVLRLLSAVRSFCGLQSAS